jgi:hypothetical protein
VTGENVEVGTGKDLLSGENTREAFPLIAEAQRKELVDLSAELGQYLGSGERGGGVDECGKNLPKRSEDGRQSGANVVNMKLEADKVQLLQQLSQLRPCKRRCMCM